MGKTGSVSAGGGGGAATQLSRPNDFKTNLLKPALDKKKQQRKDGECVFSANVTVTPNPATPNDYIKVTYSWVRTLECSDPKTKQKLEKSKNGAPFEELTTVPIGPQKGFYLEYPGHFKISDKINYRYTIECPSCSGSAMDNEILKIEYKYDDKAKLDIPKIKKDLEVLKKKAKAIMFPGQDPNR